MNSDSDIFIRSEKNETLMPLKEDYIRSYLEAICNKIGIDLDVNKILSNVYPKLKKYNTINDIDDQIIASASEMAVDHHLYPKIGTYLLMRNLHKITNADYSNVVRELISNTDKHGKPKPVLSKSFTDFVYKYQDQINSAFKYDTDYEISLFGYRTLEKSYLKKNSQKKIIERPQHMFMRVAIAIHYRAPYTTIDQTLEKIFQTYNLLSEGYFTHATPTLFNAGTNNEQLASCFLMGIEDDMEKVGICWGDSAIISKYGGGVGIHVTNLRYMGADISSTQGKASGMSIATVFNAISRYAHQGGRPGSFALYIEPWHADIMYFLDLKKNTGAETERARDLFLGLTINDIFMERVEADGIWSLMCPSECPDLLDKFGEEFTKIYESYESAKKYIYQIPARDIWFKILESEIETGVPYILYKDSTNKKSNQANIGVINGSNLCVAGDTQILTSQGYYPIASLVNKEVSVWNGIEFSRTTIKQTGTNQSLLQIGFSNGSSLKCTSYHKFYIQVGNEVIIKPASELFIGDQLVSTTYPIIIDPNMSYTNADTHTDVPVNQNLETKMLYLRQLIDKLSFQMEHDDLGHLRNITIEHNNKLYLTNLKYMLQTIGCDPDVKFNNYDTFVLILYQADIAQLIELGLNFSFDTDSLPDISLGPNIIPNRNVLVEYIYENIGSESTYCFNEPIRHMGIFNGIIAGNCIEIVEVSTADEYAVCNLSSICLPKFFEPSTNTVSYQKLYEISRIITRNLNNMIDINFYPLEKTRTSNISHRPIGIGVQGLADLFMLFKIPFDSDQARDINKKVFETIYFGFLSESADLAVEFGPYDTFVGSPLSKGLFQFDLWDVSPSGIWDWDTLRTKIMTTGVRNSLGTACMPTASTSLIMGNNETVEPITSNIYSRSTMSGDYYVVNKYLMNDLIDLGLWNSDMIDLIKYYEGSIQHIDFIPDHIKQIYRTVWEIEQKSIVEMAADRAPYLDQTQSMNIFMAKNKFYPADHYANAPLNARLSSSHFLGWKLGLKTGIYYLRTRPASEANQFGIDINKIKELETKYKLADILTVDSNTNDTAEMVCALRPSGLADGETCMMCSS